MKLSDFSPQFSTLWAQSGTTTTVQYPLLSGTSLATGRASIASGFPAVNFTPPAAGGVYPWGADWNGALRTFSVSAQNYEAGIIPSFSSAFAAAISGYPLNAVIADATTPGLFYYSTADGNLTAPEAAGSLWASASAGRFLASHIILSSQTFTPLATTRYLRVRMIGGGGAGGGAAANASGGNGVSCGAAGANGAYCEFWIDLASLGVSSFILSVGAAGSGSVGGQGGQGGATSFDNRIICNGGQGGQVSGSVASGVAISVSQSAGGAVDVVNSAGMSGVLAYDGQNGPSALIVSNGSGNVGIPNPSEGASSPLGSGGGNAIGGTPTKVATGLGASGGAAASNTAAAYAGGDGAQGGFLIEEYSA